MRTIGILLLLLPTHLCAPPLGAQDVREGSVVRIHGREPSPRTGEVSGVSADTLWLRTDRSTRPIPLSAIHRLELRQGVPRAQSGWKWAKRGLVVGAALGGVTCLADREQCESNMGPGDGLAEGLLASTLFYGGGTAAIGFVAGAAFPGTRWIEVRIPVGAVPGTRGRQGTLPFERSQP